MASVPGAQIFRGLAYSVAVAPAAATNFSVADGAPRGSTAYIVVGAFLTAAFSLIPLALGLLGLRCVIDDDPTWLTGLLRAAGCGLTAGFPPLDQQDIAARLAARVAHQCPVDHQVGGRAEGPGQARRVTSTLTPSDCEPPPA